MPAATRAADLLRMSRPQLGRKLTKEEQVKFLLTTVAPALIQPEEADRLIDYVIDESVIFQMATVERMDTNEKEIRFIDKVVPVDVHANTITLHCRTPIVDKNGTVPGVVRYSWHRAGKKESACIRFNQLQLHVSEVAQRDVGNEVGRLAAIATSIRTEVHVR